MIKRKGVCIFKSLENLIWLLKFWALSVKLCLIVTKTLPVTFFCLWIHEWCSLCQWLELIFHKRLFCSKMQIVLLLSWISLFSMVKFSLLFLWYARHGLIGYKEDFWIIKRSCLAQNGEVEVWRDGSYCSIQIVRQNFVVVIGNHLPNYWNQCKVWEDACQQQNFQGPCTATDSLKKYLFIFEGQ